MTMSQMTLTKLSHKLVVARLSADAPIPDWALESDFFSITRTADELSIVCRQSDVPTDVQCQGDWFGLKVAGPLDFALTGILAGLAAPLAAASIPIFAISTYDTDYLLIPEAEIERAVTVLRAAGHDVRGVDD